MRERLVLVLAGRLLVACALGAAAQNGGPPQSATEAAREAVAQQTSAALPQKTTTPSTLRSGQGKRDPFLSPVNHGTTASECSVGRRCLQIGQISVRGIVRADAGMIAVVVTAAGKAYFLRENDAVWHGYVKHIAEDAVIFVESTTDKRGKPLRREVVQKLAPAPTT